MDLEPPTRRAGPAATLLALVLIVGLALGGALTPLGIAAGRAVDVVSDALWDPEDDLSFPRMPERSTIYADDGTVLARLFLDEHRKVVSLERIRRPTLRAVLAAEDARFHHHIGVDPAAIARAALRNLAAGEVEQGGSTITQQVARGSFAEVGREETFERKLREARTALRLEQVYTKDQILEIYLNQVYLGRGVYGIGTAAEYYFAKDVEDLTLAESALLAGMIATPERATPVNDRRAARERRAMTLERMVELGWITPARAERAAGSRINLSPSKRKILQRPRAPFFVEFIKRQILEDPRFGETRQDRIRTLFQGGLEIHTTLDPELQRAGGEAIADRLPHEEDPGGAVVAVRPGDGAIRALVGGDDFRDQQFDLASQGRRQAGSAFKTFTLVAALDSGMSPRRTYPGSSPRTIPVVDGPDWTVRNAGGASYGTMDLRRAAASSVNTVFAQLIMDVGPRRVANVAARMGIESHLPAVPSLALGTAPVSPLEMTVAYATLANDGRRCDPFAIREVLDRDGRTVYERDRRCERAISFPVAATTVDVLADVMTAGTGRAARLDPWPAFGKTGTTDDHADAWFSGCTVQLCASAWVGHIEGRIPMTDVQGGRVWGGNFPSLIWRDFMISAMQGRPVRHFSDPPPLRGDRARVLVPDVVGMGVGEARSVLRDAGFGVTVSWRATGEQARHGEVTSQSPAGRERAREGSTVVIVVLRHEYQEEGGEREAQDEREDEPTGSPSPAPSPVPSPSPSPVPTQAPPPPAPSPSPEPEPEPEPEPHPEPEPDEPGEPVPGPSPTPD